METEGRALSDCEVGEQPDQLPSEYRVKRRTDMENTKHVRMRGLTLSDRFNEWEILHGINPWVNDAYLDKDGDSYPNIYEYVWDTNPSDPTSMPSVAVSVGPGSPVNSIQQAFDMAKHDYLIIKLVPGHVYEGQGNENVSINPVARNFLILCSGATANSVSVAHGFFNHRTGASGFIKNSERIIGSIVRNSPQRYQPSSSPNTPGTH